ncbi:MAG: preprotein translocase subunit SecY [Puniceicoccales bacterium]|jgi:preprotein translocase subunit SecY|nr:preprotein translocase subunit SecY [Puniceicoccales bacterium]
MIAGFVNFFRVSELRTRLFFTLLFVFVARVGANIPLPGLDPMPLRMFFADQVAAARGAGLVGLYNMFTGGALLKGAIFGLGIMPYISASIVMQLLSVVMPSLARLQLEGEVGRYRLAQYTRYLTLAICLLQGILLVAALANYPGKLFAGFNSSHYGPIVVTAHGWFFFSSTLFLTTGTMVLVWIGDQISRRGIGSGISLLIVVGILSSLPRSLQQVGRMILGRGDGVMLPWSLRLMQILGMGTLLLAVILAMIAMTQGQRKIPVQHTKHVVGNRIYAGSSSFLPLKVNYSGVMPIIFGSALLLFPQQIFAYLGAATGMHLFQSASYHLSQGSGLYYALYALLIFAFSYLWVAMMFQPTKVADELKKNGGYIPGVRPGTATAQFLDFVMTRLTFAGAIFLTTIAVLPDLLYFLLHIPYGVALFFGGTGTLIVVGVLLEMMRQVETYLVQRNYDGFLKKAKGSSSLRRLGDGALEARKVCRRLAIGLGVLFAIGLLAWLLRVAR